MGLGERISPSSVSDLRKNLFNLEPLSDAITLHGRKRVLARWGWAGEKSDFFSILLRGHRHTIGKSEGHVLAIRWCHGQQWLCFVSDLLRHPKRRNLLDGDIVQVDRVIIELTPIGNGAFQCRDALLDG
jgi:hypothetical protein